MSRGLSFIHRKGGKSAPLEERADALRGLSGLLRLGLSPRRALMAWPEAGPTTLQGALARVSRKIALGAPFEPALRALDDVFEEDATALSFLLDTASTLGGRSAAMIEALASSIEKRASFGSQARAAGSGAVLSGRLIAGLPLAFIPLAPLARAPLFDALGLVTLVAGGGLAALGIIWIARLMPEVPNSDDSVAMLADVTAAVLAGGTQLDAALDLLAARPPAALKPPLRKAARLVRLGARWPDALASSGDAGLESLAAAIRRATSLGVSIGPSLESWAETCRSEMAHRFEAMTRRAGVLMMVPLAICVLPAFILLGIVPFLRGLSLG